MPAKTSAASASCGTHFGLTKLVASIVRSPHAERRSISAILSAVATKVASFWRPSRAPTSTMRMESAIGGGALEAHLAAGEQLRVAQLARIDRRGDAHGQVAALARDLALELIVDDAVRELLRAGVAQ